MSGRRLELLANIPELSYTETTKRLTASFVREGLIPARASNDAVHIAVATAYECDYLLTWNCTHIVNAQIQRRIRTVMRDNGFEPPVICTPEELMGED